MIVVINKIDVVVFMNTLTVRRAVEAEAMTIAVDVEIG
jgi:hypothetical protein